MPLLFEPDLSSLDFGECLSFQFLYLIGFRSINESIDYRASTSTIGVCLSLFSKSFTGDVSYERTISGMFSGRLINASFSFLYSDLMIDFS